MSPAASTRWCPTPEQVMILEEMYRGGVRTPNAAQIQQITSHLSLYGKIEGKNVFYWFQNHKARDRQKLRKKLLGKQLQQHNQLMFSSHHHHHNHMFPPFDHHQHFQHHNNFLHHLNFDQPLPLPLPPPLPPLPLPLPLPPLPLPLPLPPPLSCCGPTPSSLGLFHHQLPPVVNSPCFVAHQTRAEDTVVPRMTNTYTWNQEYTSDAKYGRVNTMPMITNHDHDHDDDWMALRSGDHHHDHHDHHDHDDEYHPSRRPLKTLELFPVNDKTSLKDGHGLSLV